MKALGRLKDKDAVEPLVAGLADLQKRQAAAAALKSLGVPAEREVRKALEHAEWQVRLEAVRILKEIGTAESVATLKSVGTSDDNALVKREAKEAAKAIEDRK
jgi:HEAT repeat protein